MRLFRKPALKIFAAVIAALVLGSFIAAVSHNGTSPLSRAVGFVFSPAQKLAAGLSRELSHMPYSFRSASVISAEKDELQKELDSMRNQLVEFEQLKRQNELYREFLELKEENPDQKYCEANIIGRDSADFAGEFTLSKGSLSGISVQDPVIYGSSLVGVVSAVTPTTCTVKTILNPDVNVSCYEIRTATTGYVTTTAQLAEKGLCHMPNLEGTTPVTIGGIVCTSGVGGVYPANLVIGTITEIDDATVDISAAAVIEPAANLDTVTGVFVITEFEGQGMQ
ncbi:MAG: rod shape-determining protein MreC [Clostridia bacterium]|nr:rod shape-determining protein MreC [Clostridia bacterium]